MPKRKLKIKPFTPEPSDLTEIAALTDLLFELLGNDTKCARALSISRKAWHRLSTKQDDWPYWSLILHNVISTVLAETNARHGSWTAGEKFYQKAKLAKLTSRHKIRQQVFFLTEEFIGAQQFLRTELSHGGLQPKTVIKAAETAGYSARSIYKAAETMGIRRITRGFGAKKTTRWYLPTNESMQELPEYDELSDFAERYQGS